MKDVFDANRRCNYCRKFYLRCDLNNHNFYGLICKSCFDELEKNKR